MAASGDPEAAAKLLQPAPEQRCTSLNKGADELFVQLNATAESVIDCRLKLVGVLTGETVVMPASVAQSVVFVLVVPRMRKR